MVNLRPESTQPFRKKEKKKGKKRKERLGGKKPTNWFIA